MKVYIITAIIILTNLLILPVYSQTGGEEELLGLPGDNLDLYAVLDLFQKSKTIEDFEKSLNDSETKVNNLDLNLDDKIDFIKVKTEQEEKDFSFILQTDVTDKETQDIAVILLSKDKADKVTLQIVGDKDLYGKNYVIEPRPKASSVTPNPAYTGDDAITPAEADALSSVIVVESAPVVKYVYSPVYVPYYPPYYYGYYPPYYNPVTVIAVGIYRSNHYYYHAPYHGGYGNTTVVVHNHNTYNNYNNIRNSSNTVNHHNANGNYNRNNTANRPSNGAATRPSGATGDRPSKPTASTRPAQPAAGNKASQPSAASREQSGNYGGAMQKNAGSNATNRSTGSNSGANRSAGNYGGASRSGGSYSGAGRTGGGAGGGGRTGGGGGGRRR